MTKTPQTPPSFARGVTIFCRLGGARVSRQPRGQSVHVRQAVQRRRSTWPCFALVWVRVGRGLSGHPLSSFTYRTAFSQTDGKSSYSV